MLKTCYENLIITAAALLITALVQFESRELNFYHALLVLDWCWMLTMNALILTILPAIDTEVVFKRSLIPYPSRISLGIFGISVWNGSGSRMGGPQSFCFPEITTYIFSRRIRASQVSLRVASLALYTVASTPFFNVYFFTVMVVTIVKCINALIPGRYRQFIRFHTILWIVQTFMNIVIMLDTEQTIRANRHLIDIDSIEVESNSGFGQILTFVLVAIPALQILANKLMRKPMGGLEYQIQRVCQGSERSWKLIHNDGREMIDNVLAKLQRRPNTHINEHALTAITKTLNGAKDFLDAANDTIRGSPVADSRQKSPEKTENSSVGSPEDPPNSSAGPGTTSMAQGEASSVFAASEALPISTDGGLAQGDPVPGMTSAPNPQIGLDEIEATPAPGTPRQGGNLTESSSYPPAQDVEVTRGDHQLNETLKHDLHHLVEHFSTVCNLRFREVRNPPSFIAVRAYLRATREALGAAKAALDAI